ncbi:MAG: glycosyltransferase family 39 protein [Desulfovibrio sp.]|nr:glycosyltransferase family 39 protein [Desulfovibrio sp.]MBI4958397.1 glycosyltransferase family 39 protein [Desulfovibrio sp.]
MLELAFNLGYPTNALKPKAAPLKFSSPDRSDRLIVVAITLTAAWLRFLNIGQPSLWWDEFITVGASLKPLADMLSVLKNIGPSDIGVELFPPLVHIITHGLTLIGKNDVLMRLPGVLAGVALVPMVYLLCRRPLGRLSALCAATLITLSVYHIHYSREVRPYSLFMLENVLALHLLYEGLTQNRKRLLWGYGAVTAAMLYTSYMAATLVFAQAVFAVILLASRFRTGARNEARSLGIILCLSLAAAGVVYLPWASGQIHVFKALHDPGFKANFSWDFVTSSLKEFAAFAYRGEFPTGWTFAGLGLAGCAVAIAGKSRWFVLLMAVWSLMPVVGIFLAKARMELSSRYIFTFFLFFGIFAGHLLATGAERIADRLFGNRHPVFIARLIAALFLCLAVSRPNMECLSEYYSRETSHYKELVGYLAENRNNQDSILFYNPRNLKLILGWYGPELLRPAKNLPPQGYHRAMLLSPESVKGPEKFPLSIWRTRLEDVDVLGMGIARTPVQPMAPDCEGRFVYAENYADFKMIADAYSAHNLVPSPLSRTLTAHDAGSSGWCVYRYQALKGQSISQAKLTVELSTQLLSSISNDSQVVISIAPSGKAQAPIATINLDSFKQADGSFVPANHEMKRFITVSADLTQNLAGAESFDLRFDYADCTRSMPIEIGSFRLEASLAGQPVSPSTRPEMLLDQLPVAPWVPDQDVVLSDSVHAFSLDGRTTGPGIGSPADLKAYLSNHPGDKPVRVLTHQDDTPAIALYDPALANPFLPVAQDDDRFLSAYPAGTRQVRSFKLRGELDRPVLRIGSLGLPLPVTCPGPAELTVNPGAQAELVVSPLFTKQDLRLDSLVSQDNIRRNDDEDCLSCAEDKPCFLTYAVSSSLPITKMRITAFPRVLSDSAGRFAVGTQVSTDGKNWRDVNSYSGSGSGRWEGLKIPQYTLVSLDKPAREMLIRFVLTGQKAQLWSAPDARMRFEIRMDASRVPVPVIDSWPVRLSLSHATPLDVLLLESPQPFPDRLRRTR